MNTYAKGLIALAEIYNTVPNLPAPSISGAEIRLDVWTHITPDVAAEVARIAKAIGGRWHKNDPKQDGYTEKYYELTHDLKFGPYKLKISANRDQVCNRVPVGTKIIEHSAQPAKPARTEVVTEYAWECVPLLKKVDELAGKPTLELQQ